MYIIRRMAKFVGGQYTGQTRPEKINPLTTKNYNFFTYVQASFSWLKTKIF